MYVYVFTHTTSCQLQVRALSPASGTIAIGNVDLALINLRALRSYIALVPSRPILFQGRISHQSAHYYIYYIR